eukprot:TRINITY_DN453_c3_g1_i1.p1 TRINITY_DN453_c3_g1~~TRINITY_DN453_c3_g1_i1.p1  ORF type:complete len:451 (-),score=91.20 TRINITY_DN453_c3_g1_i1:6-1271(-)
MEEEEEWSSGSDDNDDVLPDQHAVDDKFEKMSREELIFELHKTKNLLLESQMTLAQKDKTIFELRNTTQQYLLGDEALEITTQKDIQKINKSNFSSSCDTEGDYFNSYAHFGIHYDMINDSVRTDAYRDFILGNPDLFHDKVVLDVGCGTGILSMFAAKAGARLVIAVDNSDIIHTAEKIALQNNFKNIHFIKNKVELIENLPDLDSVDIIISEWMGYCLLFECMLSSVLVARDRWCGSKGLVFPNVATMALCGFSSNELYHKKMGFWDNVYGFVMSPVKQEVVEEAQIENVPQKAIITNTCSFKSFDIQKMSLSDSDFSSPFALKVGEISSEQKFHGFVCYFDIDFNNCKKPVSFSTGPFTKDTHWHQTVLLLPSSISVSQNDDIVGNFTIKRKKHLRTILIDIQFSVSGKQQPPLNYTL